MKPLILLLTLIFGIAFFSCSTNNSAGGGVSPNQVGTPFTLKYEIISSQPILFGVNPGESYPIIFYTNSTQQGETDNSFISGTIWSKTITVTTPNRPFNALLQIMNPLVYLSSPGTLTGNLYVNGNKVAHLTNSTTQSQLGNWVSLYMDYSIQ